MKTQVKHYGFIKDGKKIYHNPALFKQQMDSLEGKQFVEIISEVKNKPSQSQYNYYRGGILVACHESEMFCHFDNKDLIHDCYFAKKFLTHRELVVLKNERYEVNVTRSLADLSDKEMSEFIDRVLAKCADLGIYVLSPTEYYNKYYGAKHT